jgi:DNA-binding CsgD family transcriptional regulator
MGDTTKSPKRQAAIQRKAVGIEERQKQAASMWIAEKTYREIAKHFGVSVGTAHSDVQTYLEKRQAELGEEFAVDVRREFGQQLRFAKKLRQAAEEVLSDPNDPLKLTIIPRADEIEVVYYDHNDLFMGQPKRKKAMLSALMEALVEQAGFEADKFTVKHVDIRKFALDAISVTDTCIDKFAKLQGDYVDAKKNPSDNLSIAKRVVEELLAKGEDRTEAVKFAATRYGVLEANLIGG